MKIINAKPIHINGIMKLADSLKFNTNDPKVGSLVAVLSEKELLARIKSKYFYVAIEDGEIQGFLIILDLKGIDYLVKQNLFYHKEILPFLEKQKEEFVYGELIGVREKKQRKGLGNVLIKKLSEELKEEGIHKLFVQIRHKPVKNVHSITFCKQLGFQYIHNEVNYEEVTFGIYEKNL